MIPKREMQLQFCKVCVNQKKDLDLGIICGLRGGVADFGETCPSFHEDSHLKGIMEKQKIVASVDAKLASQGKRLANYLIDRLFLFGFGAVIGTFLGVFLGYFAPEYLYIFEQDNLVLEYALGFAIGVIYYSFFEGFTGRSLGKFFTGTKVVLENGERPDFGTILTRSLCRFIPFNAFSFLGSKPTGWHDSLSKTRVVEID